MLQKIFQLRIGYSFGQSSFLKMMMCLETGRNITSRIQAIYKPDCVYVSESIFISMFQTKDIRCKIYKEETLKNVKRFRMYE